MKFRTEMVRELPTHSKREKEAFALLDVHEQAWRFMNWQSRLVHPHPRQLNISNEFDNLPTVRANIEMVAELLGKITRGDDVNKHLSKDAWQGYCIRSPGIKHGRDFDLLLNEWGIHHLHIAQTKGSDLIYIIFGRRVAFVLVVAPHGAWTSHSLIEITVQSWPLQRLFVPLNVLPGRDWSETEHMGLRKAGVTTAAIVDDQPWISGVTCGITTALVSVRMSIETGNLMRCLMFAEKNQDYIKSQLQVQAATDGVDWPANPEINVRWLAGPDRYCFAFMEENCGAKLHIETRLS